MDSCFLNFSLTSLFIIYLGNILVQEKYQRLFSQAKLRLISIGKWRVTSRAWRNGSQSESKKYDNWSVKQL